MGVVLLIDDEPDMGALVEMWLSDLGGRVVQVGTLEDAVARAREERPRAVLLDLALEDHDGLDLLPVLKGHPSLAGVPVVVFTVHESREREAMARGADAFVGKPFRSRDLRGALERYLS